MNNTSFIDQLTQDYISQHFESAQKIHYTDLSKAENVTKVLYKDLPRTKMEGYPVASDFVSKDGKTCSTEEFEKLPDDKKKEYDLRFYYMPHSHELYVGTTGSGKTTGCVIPQLRAISSQKNKPNIFVTDPKGELFESNAKHLKDNGYVLYTLNFKDLMHSDRWNPLMELYELNQHINTLGSTAKMHVGTVPDNLIAFGKREDFKQQEYIEFDGYAFKNGEDIDKYLQLQHDILYAKLEGILDQYTNMMIAVTSKDDLTWELGAQELLKGLLLCMLEDSSNPESGFTKNMMTLRTVESYYQALRKPIYAEEITLPEHPLMQGKSKRALNLLSTALNTAPRTMKSYCSVFDTCIKDWFRGHILAMTSDNTVDLNTGNKPFAVFLVTRDYEKSDFLIAGLFIDWVYRHMVEDSEKHKNTRPFHFLLDEFGNIPKIRDFENKISTARSRNIWFHLVVQSYLQIEAVYQESYATVIRDNCNAQIFLGSQNRATKDIFSNECGKHVIPTLRSKLVPDSYEVTEVPLIPISDLDLIKPGQMYVKRLYAPVFVSQFVRSYKCAEWGFFKDYAEPHCFEKYAPTLPESFTSEKYTYKELEKPIESSPRRRW